MLIAHNDYFSYFYADRRELNNGKQLNLRKNLNLSKVDDSKSTPIEYEKSTIISNSLRTILLQDNLLRTYPHILSSKELFPALRVIQLHGNPIEDSKNEAGNKFIGDKSIDITNS